MLLTLAAYRVALIISRRYHGHPLANTVLIGATIVVTVLLLLGMDFQQYMKGAAFIQFLLGPITVALAIPLYNNLGRLRKSGVAVLLAILAGSIAGVVTAVASGLLFNLSHPMLMSLAPRSVTTPIAMGITKQIGGHPSLTAVMVIITGILGAMLAQTLYRWLRIRDDAAAGFALGVSAHGIGTARAFQINETMGAFAALGMGLNGLLTAMTLPAIISWIKPWLQ